MSLKLLTLKNAFYGGVIYCLGDTIASLINDNFYYPRMLSMLLLGATLYAIEIPSYFHWLDRIFSKAGKLNQFKRTIMAVAFFNPLWIARHLAFIYLFSGHWSAISPDILAIALESFLHIIPFSLPVNYIIQNIIPLSWRFIASAVFSALMAIYYSLSEVFFS